MKEDETTAEAVDKAAQKKKKKKAAKKAKDTSSGSARPASPGSAKGIETMFRNACRAELDLIALAATKANIMISLNGLIISALIISGAFIFASSPQFLLPAGVFLITAAVSIVFALLAASPERIGLFGAVRDWARAMVRREAGPGDLPDFVNARRTKTEAETENAAAHVNPLIAGNRTHLSEDDYWMRMQEVMTNHDDVYRAMSAQIYWLGQMGNQKLRLLDISYTVFRWGLLLTVLVFFAAWGVMGLLPRVERSLMTGAGNFGIGALADIYEPSALQQLPDGRILAVEDEASRAFSLLTLTADGRFQENPAGDQRLLRSFGRKMSDLEGLSIDGEGRIYATTSHSTKNKGKRDADREQLLRFEVSGGVASGLAVYTGLRNALSKASDLKGALEEASGEEVDFDDLNIEGLAYVQETGELLLGLRTPMVGGRSLVVAILNPADLVERGAAPRFGPPLFLDMQGGGIRALSFDPVLKTYLVVNEVEQPEGGRISQLWKWDGGSETPPVPLSLPGIIDLDNVESIDSVVIGGERRLLLMSDEGNAKKNRPARYLMLAYDLIGEAR